RPPSAVTSNRSLHPSATASTGIGLHLQRPPSGRPPPSVTSVGSDLRQRAVRPGAANHQALPRLRPGSRLPRAAGIAQTTQGEAVLPSVCPASFPVDAPQIPGAAPETRQTGSRRPRPSLRLTASRRRDFPEDPPRPSRSGMVPSPTPDPGIGPESASPRPPRCPGPTDGSGLLRRPGRRPRRELREPPPTLPR
ncbi:proline-rich protein 2-like, partial [Tachyglossus aculeatus]|uniref:proline-rich protein 2-like n=1 Tax=Tachyglossus aculeatus TaxID=9261 RepID=UPI0018F2940D